MTIRKGAMIINSPNANGREMNNCFAPLRKSKSSLNGDSRILANPLKNVSPIIPIFSARIIAAEDNPTRNPLNLEISG